MIFGRLRPAGACADSEDPKVAAARAEPRRTSRRLIGFIETLEYAMAPYFAGAAAVSYAVDGS
jgi:hypothetical protein